MLLQTTKCEHTFIVVNSELCKYMVLYTNFSNGENTNDMAHSIWFLSAAALSLSLALFLFISFWLLEIRRSHLINQIDLNEVVWRRKNTVEKMLMRLSAIFSSKQIYLTNLTTSEFLPLSAFCSFLKMSYWEQNCY